MREENSTALAVKGKKPHITVQEKSNNEKETRRSREKNIIAQFLRNLRYYPSNTSPPPLLKILYPRKLHQTAPSKNFNIDISLHTCIHGYLTPNLQQAASLLILNLQLASLNQTRGGGGGTFNRILLSLNFEDIPGTQGQQQEEQKQPPARTTILAHAPFELAEPQNEKEMQIERRKNVELTTQALLDVLGSKSGVGIRTSDETTTRTTRRYHGTGSSGTLANSEGRITGIWWNVKRSSDPDAGDDAGIAANYRFAILLTRESRRAEFRMGLEMVVDAGWKYKLESRFSRIKVDDGGGGRRGAWL